MDISVIFKWLWLAKEAYNVFTVNNANENPDWLQNFVVGLEGMQTFADLMAQLSSQLTLTAVGARYPDGEDTYTIYQPTNIVGGVNAEDCPGQVAILCSLAAVAPKPNRGRIYLPGLVETRCGDGGQIASQVTTAVGNFFSEWAIDGIPVDGFGASYLRIGRRNPKGQIVLSRPVNTVTPRETPATIRNRRRGST